MLKIWDLPTRVYHWLQALLFTGLVLSGYGLAWSEKQHQAFGILLFTLIIWRIIWGIIGSETDKFVSFFPTKQRMFDYLRDSKVRSIGHNPLGGLMVIIMILLLLIQGVTGFYLSSLVDGKALLGRQTLKILEETHVINALLLEGCSIFHIIAIAVYKIKGQPLVKAMITGNVKVTASLKQPALASKRSALFMFFASVCIVLLMIILNR